MSSSSRNKNLFHSSTTSDKLTFFQLLLDARELSVDIALALLKIIHKELSTHHTPDRSVYKRYAETIESLRYQTSDLLRQVNSAWKTEQGITPEEWFAHENPNRRHFKDSE